MDSWEAQLRALIGWRGRAWAVDLLCDADTDLTHRAAIHLLDVIEREHTASVQSAC